LLVLRFGPRVAVQYKASECKLFTWKNFQCNWWGGARNLPPLPSSIWKKNGIKEYEIYPNLKLFKKIFYLKYSVSVHSVEFFVKFVINKLSYMFHMALDRTEK
jgi:hypothetical protein